jgi:hypothetical protein
MFAVYIPPTDPGGGPMDGVVLSGVLCFEGLGTRDHSGAKEAPGKCLTTHDLECYAFRVNRGEPLGA